jgi:RNA polymerase sigma-70 factor (ECF subfamily)
LKNEPEQDISDDELIRAVVAGDLEAFGTLYERYLKPIYRYVYYRISAANDAEDLTEEIFVRAWRSLQKTGKSTEIKNFKAWLYRIAHNLVVDYHRQNREDLLEDISEDQRSDQHGPAAEEISIRDQQHLQLEEAIRSMDHPMQQVIILRFINGLSHAETAAIIGIKEGHVRVLQYRALKKLRGLLEKDL